ncbi:MAG: hypothetical protein LIV28_03190 [Lactobacillus sp.]|nr:hypothetical protein [Lactobacillus sp.]
MLDKKYCTASILFAANVVDGGRTIDEVPAPFKTDVQALLKTDESAQTTSVKQIVPVTSVDTAKQTVVVKSTDTLTKED